MHYQVQHFLTFKILIITASLLPHSLNISFLHYKVRWWYHDRVRDLHGDKGQVYCWSLSQKLSIKHTVCTLSSLSLCQWIFLVGFSFLFGDRVLLCHLGWPWTCNNRSRCTLTSGQLILLTSKARYIMKARMLCSPQHLQEINQTLEDHYKGIED